MMFAAKNIGLSLGCFGEGGVNLSEKDKSKSGKLSLVDSNSFRVILKKRMSMKKIFVILFLSLSMPLLIASSGWSLLIPAGTYETNAVDVGDVDSFLTVEHQDVVKIFGSGIAAETNWVTGYLRTYTGDAMANFEVITTYDPLTLPLADEDLEGKIETVPYYKVEDPTDADDDTYAFYLGSPQTDYFIVKNSTYYALFQNIDDFDWGVFDVSDVGESGLNLGTEGYTISHVTRFDGAPAPVPEPSTVLLVGLGLVGLVGYNRKRNRK